MATKRHPAMTLVAYFLSRCGEVVPDRQSPRPPKVLMATTWERAYAMFYRMLGDGRTFAVFRNSMKNVRDYFDSHIDSGRVGWRTKGFVGTDDRPPRPLSRQTKEVIDAWQSRSDDELWEAVKKYADQSAQSVDDSIISDLAAELDPQRQAIIARTEGGRKVIVSIRVERDPSLRAAALNIHGTTCASPYRTHFRTFARERGESAKPEVLNWQADARVRVLFGGVEANRTVS